MELMQASRQWATRPADERFTDLPSMLEKFEGERRVSRELVVSSRRIQAVPESDNKGILIEGGNGHGYAPTHWSFGQLSQLGGAPAAYLRGLPSPIAADCLNYGLQIARDVEDVKILLTKNGSPVLRAANGPRYGRIWNADLVRSLIEHFGDGISGDFRVPGEFGKEVIVTKSNTTLYAGDRNLFVFLADEKNRIEIPNRRNGKMGSLARGFFCWNSEVGAETLGLGTFLFDYTCCNRIVWGAEQYQEIAIRHTVSAPDKWLEQMEPALIAYKESSAEKVVSAVEIAQQAKLDKVDEFLANRFGPRMAQTFMAIHNDEEGRPIETVWDAVTAVTAYARRLDYQDARVDLERQAGQMMDAA